MIYFDKGKDKDFKVRQYYLNPELELEEESVC
jgi:hypothetical protein